MTTIIITLLVISQIVNFYIIFKRLKPNVIKPDGLVLKPIPNDVNYEDIDPNHDLIYEVLETIKLEDWELEVESDHLGRGSWRLTFTSNDYLTTVRTRITEYSNKEMKLSMFHISGPNGLISLKSDSKISNDVILFLWDYVIQEYENRNKKDKQTYISSIEGIRNSLKTLKRSKRLNNILNEKT